MKDTKKDPRPAGIRPVDLHVHSTASDGTLSPKELVDLAVEKGLAAFALTDHDTVGGVEEAVEYAAQAAQAPNPPSQTVEVIPGIELSSEYQGADIHVVGLYIDRNNEAFQKHLKDFVDSRTQRNRKMCALLQKEGIPITYQELLSAYPDSVITRAHYMRYLLEKGYVKTRQEAFDRYIGDGAPCYIPREKITPAQAVELILTAGGAPVLAHPILYHMSDEGLDTLVKKLTEAGLMGIEAIYSTYTEDDQRKIRRLASKYHLLISGGSDFHGANKPGLQLGSGYGSLFVPCTLLQEIKTALGRL